MEEAEGRPAHDRTGPHRPGRCPVEPRRDLRRRRGGRQEGRHLPLGRPRRDLGAAQRLRPAGPVLRPRRRRSQERGPHLRHERVSCRCPTTAARRCASSARSGSTSITTTIWIDPRNTRHYLVGCDGGIYESLRPRRHLGVQRQPAGDAVLRRRGRRRRPVLSRLRRHAGQLHPGRPGARRSVHGIINADWFVVQGGDGFHCKVDPKDPDTVYAEIAVRRAGALRPAHRAATGHPAPARPGRAAAALELGLAAAGQPALAHAPLLRRQQGSSAATTAATRGRRSAAT